MVFCLFQLSFMVTTWVMSDFSTIVNAVTSLSATATIAAATGGVAAMYWYSAADVIWYRIRRV